MLNQFRLIQDSDDGCSVYECLSCKNIWEVRCIGITFCSYCVTKFISELVVWNQDKKYTKLHHINIANKNTILPTWNIYEKTNWNLDEIVEGDDDWIKILSIYGNAKFARNNLQFYRKKELNNPEKNITITYKIEIIPRKI